MGCKEMVDIRIYKDHADKEWIEERIGGHGGAYYVGNSKNSRASIKWIGGVSRFRILWYNIQLLVRYFMRMQEGYEK